MSALQEVQIGDLSQALSVRKGYPTVRASREGEVPVLSVAALRNETVPKHFADEASIDEVDLARPGDVLLAIEGGTVGETFVVPTGFRSFVPSQQAATFRVTDDSMIHPAYLGAWMATEQAREAVRRLTRGTGIQRVPFADLAGLPIPLPPLERQQEIGHRFAAFEAAIESHRSVTTCLEELRDVDLVATFTEISSQRFKK